MAGVLKTCQIAVTAAAVLFLNACATPPRPPETAPAPVSLPAPVQKPPATSAVAAPVLVAPAPAPASNVVIQPSPAAVDVPKPSAKRTARPGWILCDAWSQSAGWGKPQRLRNVPVFAYDLQSTNGLLQIIAGNRTALWNGINLELGFAPRLTNGEPALHSLDIAKTLEPLTMRPDFLRQTNRVVVLDPGHGGENYGARSAVCDCYEKQYALDWAVRLAPLLRREGWTVYLTRTNDMELSLAGRVAFADTVAADLFISLHFNSTDQPPGRTDHGGVETYCLTPVGMPSTLTRHYEDEQDRCYPNNAFDAENFYFAARLQRALVRSTQRKDRGVRRARFMGVLRGQNRPAVLIEGGYLTDPGEARLIGRPEHRQKLAEAVAKALAE